jgi:uncharacterized protein YggL (DUF469 family)
MKKRTRKKRHLGEFRTMGFTIRARWQSELIGLQFDSISDEFLDALVDRGMECGGGLGPGDLHVVVQSSNEYGSTTEEGRKQIMRWLESCSNIESFAVSESWDLYHSSDPLGTEIAKPLRV